MMLFRGFVGDKLNELICWPCLLFSKGKHVFNCAGYNDINNVYGADKRHIHSVDHVACLKEITLFVKTLR
jgi:predicted metal-dependent HD superfamily phosphohydrolase